MRGFRAWTRGQLGEGKKSWQRPTIADEAPMDGWTAGENLARGISGVVWTANMVPAEEAAG